MDFLAILSFLGKVAVIDCSIELLRYAAKVITDNVWHNPHTTMSHNDSRHWWVLNSVETGLAALFLYLGHRMPFIIVGVFCIMLVLKWVLHNIEKIL